MSRVFWMGVGAVGGIVAYRKADQVYAEARERGFAGNVSLLAGGAGSLLTKVSRATEPRPIVTGQLVAPPAPSEPVLLPTPADVIDITDAAMNSRRSAIRLEPREGEGEQLATLRRLRTRSARRRDTGAATPDPTRDNAATMG